MRAACQAARPGVAVVIGAGRIGQTIAAQLAGRQRIILADPNTERLDHRCITAAGHVIDAHHVDMSQPGSIAALFDRASAAGSVKTVVHTAGIWPTHATIDDALLQSLRGTAHLIELCGQVIAPGGAMVVLSCLTGHWTTLNDDDEAVLGHIPASDLLDLPFLAPHQLGDPLDAYRIAQRCNQLRARAASVLWSPRGARINSISAGTASHPYPLATLDTGIPPDAHSPTVDDIASAATYLLGPTGRRVSGIDLRIDNGANAARWSTIDSHDDVESPRPRRHRGG